MIYIYIYRDIFELLYIYIYIYIHISIYKGDRLHVPRAHNPLRGTCVTYACVCMYMYTNVYMIPPLIRNSRIPFGDHPLNLEPYRE